MPPWCCDLHRCCKFWQPDVIHAQPQVGDLQYASPATVSRCGMVFVDSRNLGYMPYVNTWLVSRYAHCLHHTHLTCFVLRFRVCIQDAKSDSFSRNDVLMCFTMHQDVLTATCISRPLDLLRLPVKLYCMSARSCLRVQEQQCRGRAAKAAVCQICYPGCGLCLGGD